MSPIRKGDGTVVEPNGISEVRTGDGRVFYDTLVEVSRWRFEQDVTDSWDGNNDAVDETSAGYATDAKRGSYSKQFNGNGGYVEVSSLTEIDTSGDFTLTFWANFDGVTDSYPRLVAKGGIEVYYDTDKSEFVAVWSFVDVARTGVSKSNGSWYFIAQRQAGQNGAIYIDGVEEGATSITPSDDGSSITIGGAGGSNSFDGEIDDVRWYSKALSDAQIQDIYNGTD
jgi:hypothetical protein